VQPERLVELLLGCSCCARSLGSYLDDVAPQCKSPWVGLQELPEGSQVQAIGACTRLPPRQLCNNVDRAALSVRSLDDALHTLEPSLVIRSYLCHLV